MDFSLFYSAGSAFVGVLSGWLVARIRYKKECSGLEVEKVSLAQALQMSQREQVRVQLAHEKLEKKLYDGEGTLRELYGRLTATEERLSSLAHFRQECVQLNQELCVQRENNSSLKVELREISIRLEETRLATEEKQRLLINNEQRLSLQFETLSHRIFEENGRKVNEQNQKNLDLLLMPLREQLDGFRRQVQDNFTQETRERYILSHEIQNLQQLNAKITQETVNLTQALKGDNKVQGNWGEIILSRVLEASGLREGHEFQTQVSVSLDGGRRLQPDVVVRLPKGKDVIIDAKMSLLAYARYCNSNDEAERQLALLEHVNSFRAHMKLLGKKDYQQLPGLQLLDYVLMFVPVEPAFMIAINQQPELITEALAYNIMLVSPTTLLVALRTINNLWHHERQNRNAQHIAERASRLYDKIRLFIDDMNNIGQSFNKAQASYRLAMNKLLEGRGNIICQAEKFRTLGVEIKRPISPILTVSESNLFFIDHPSSSDSQTNQKDTDAILSLEKGS